MNYNVAQLLKEPVGSTRSYRISGPVLSDDGDSEFVSEGRVALMRTDRGILVTAELEVHLRVTCSRCLRACPHSSSILMEEEYLPTVDINTGQSIHILEEDGDSFTINQQHSLDLRDALREYNITNQPMKPLCHQDCRGLCFICGTDRNEVPCSCQEDERDPRWGPLLKLLEESNP